MKKLIVGVLAAAALVVPGGAAAGGWATAGLSPPSPPGGSGPGDPWTTEITVLQHGVTPLAGVTPKLILTNQATNERMEYPGRPTDERGVYRVRLDLPAKGTYEVAVYDGFETYGGAQTHTFLPITVGPVSAPSGTPAPEPTPAPAAADDGFPVWPVALGTLVALLAAVGVAGAAWRSRRKAPLTA